MQERMFVFAVEVDISNDAERSWMTLHTDTGPILFGNYYRPPDAELQSLQTLQAEVEKHMCDHIGTILVGDFNIHHQSWLQYSNRNTSEGRLLKQIASNFGWREKVSAPTRGEFLLDLCLTDLKDECQTTILPEIADHKVVEISLKIISPTPIACRRHVWLYQQADWQSMKQTLDRESWNFLHHDSVDDSATKITQILYAQICAHVPFKIISNFKSEHPWIDADCVAAIKRKNLVVDVANLKLKTAACNATLRSACQTYVDKVRMNHKI